MNINKNEMVSKMAEISGMTKKDSEKALSAFMGAVKEFLVSGDKILLTGFMSIETISVPEREHRNPKTGENIIVPDHRKIKVKIGKVLKDTVK